MTLSIIQMMQNEGDNVYYTPEWHRCVESHLEWIRKRPLSLPLKITPNDAYKYEGDLMGLLLAYNFRMEYHWVIMRVNDMSSPADFSAETMELIIPDLAEVDNILAVFRTTYKKIS